MPTLFLKLFALLYVAASTGDGMMDFSNVDKSGLLVLIEDI